MSGEGGEFDPTTTDDKTTEVSGGGDDSAQDWQSPEVPDDTSAQRRKFRWPGGARPKGSHEKIPMSEFPLEKSGSPPPKGGEGTADTSFIEGLDYGEAKILLVNQKLMDEYLRYGKSGNLLNLEYEVDNKGKGKVFVIGPQGGRYPLFKADGETLNPGLPKAVLGDLGEKTTDQKLFSKMKKRSKVLIKKKKKTSRLQKVKTKNLLSVNALVIKLERITRRLTGLKMKMNGLGRIYPFGSG